MLEDLIEFAAMDNIAEGLDERELSKIGEDVVKGFDADIKSRSGWEGEMKEAMDLALQVQEIKNFPWANAANVKLPLITEAIIQYNSTMYPALVPPTDLVKSRIVGSDPNGQKQEQSIRVSKHMSYQVLEEMDWEEDMDIGLIIQPLLGNMYKKTYPTFDGGYKPVSEMLSVNEFVVDYWTKKLNKAYRKTQILNFTKNDIKKKVLSGEFLRVELGDPKVEDKGKEGESAPQLDSSTTYKVLEQHTYLNLKDDDNDEDDLEIPYIITVDYNSRKVLRITAGYDVDDIVANEDDEVIDVPQEQYFTKYGFIPNPDGAFLDLGLGKLLAPTNKTVNTLINQLLDSGTMNNLHTGFLGRGAKMKGGNLKVRMGELARVDATGDDLRKSIFMMPSKDPSSVLFNLLNLLINSGQRLASTLDSQVGENPGQNQKATTSQIVEENGQKIFGGIYKRNHRALKSELKKIFALNGKYLESDTYINILDGKLPEGSKETISSSDYDAKSLNLVPAADSAYTSTQMRMAKARALMEKIPLGTVNPVVATKRSLEAEEQSGIEQIMEMPQQQPPIEEREFQHKQSLEMAQHNLEIMKSKREDLKVFTNAIKALAEAEGVEPGQQLQAYKLRLEGIVKDEEQKQASEDRQYQRSQAQPQGGAVQE